MATDVAAGLPEVDLSAGSIITVSVDVAGATITALNVHGDDSADATPETIPPPSPRSGAYLMA